MARLCFDDEYSDDGIIKLGDIIYLDDEEYLVCKLSNGKIGLFDVIRYRVTRTEYKDLDEITSYMRNKKVKKDRIFIGRQWTIYYP